MTFDVIRIVIPGQLPSLNNTMTWHWSKRRAKKKEYFYFIRQSYGAPLPFKRRKEARVAYVSIVVYQKTRRFDRDNLYGALKPVIDVLRESGFIYNDSERWLRSIYEQKIDRNDPRIEIKILDGGDNVETV